MTHEVIASTDFMLPIDTHMVISLPRSMTLSLPSSPQNLHLKIKSYPNTHLLTIQTPSKHIKQTSSFPCTYNILEHREQPEDRPQYLLHRPRPSTSPKSLGPPFLLFANQKSYNKAIRPRPVSKSVLLQNICSRHTTAHAAS